jgi:bifunctional DNA primase/polymerase-like protein/AAA domain-containing protein/primase-like protein
MTAEAERISPILNAALTIAKNGWPVFPCNPLDKRPLCKHGFKDATTDEFTITEWLKTWPNAMIGVPMGEASGVFCIDLDRKEGGTDGVATWEELISANGPGAQTREHRTPSTGQHLVYKWEPGIRNIPLNKLAPGIEIKGEGGYIVVPPSRMGDGREYVGNDAAIVSAPDWFLKMMRSYWGDGGELDDELRRDAGKGVYPEAGYEKKPVDDDELREALHKIPADDYDIWFRVAGALFKERGQTGIHFFDAWSRKSKKYSARDVKRKWKDASKITNISAGTIFHMADEYSPGWREAYYRRRQHEPPKSTLSSASSSSTANPQSKPTASPTTPVHKFPRVDIAGWTRQNLPDQEWSVDNRIPLRSTCLFTGEGSAGKSLIQLQLCVAHCLEQEWMHSRVRQGPAIFIDAEDPPDVMQRRLLDVLDYYGATMKDISKHLYISSLIGQDAVLAAYSYKAGVVQKTALYDRLYEMVADIKPVMIGIASSADVFSGNEIDRSQVRQFIAFLTRLAMVANGTVSLIAHPSLTGIATGTGISGNTAWHNSVRARMYLRSMEGSTLRELQFMKNNYGPLAASVVVQWDRGVFVPVVTGEIGAPTKLDIAKEVFVNLLQRYTTEGRIVNDRKGPTFAPTMFMDEPEARTMGCTRDMLRDAMLDLIRDKMVEVEGYNKNGREHWRLKVGGKWQGNKRPSEVNKQELPF